MRPGAHALITGAAGAIGAAIARSLRAVDEGVRLTLVDRDEDGARAVAGTLGGARASGAIDVARWDLARPDALPDQVAALVAARGAVDVLVNCAGVMEVRSLATTPWPVAEALLQIDLVSPLRLMSLLVPGMIERREGVVVNVASMAGVTPLRGASFYGAAKAGLAMASEIAHLELERHGVHVVTVYPGPVRSALEQRARGQYVDSPFARLAPTGDPEVLGRRIVEACTARRSRVVYPALYDLASRVPTLATRFTRAFSPAPAG